MRAMHVAVIGAGIVGLLTAAELRARGHRVEIHAEGVADGATFAAAGMLAPAAEIQVGQGPLWAIMREASQAHRDLASRLAARTSVDPGYRDDSTVMIGRDHADAAALRDLAEIQRSTGAAVRELTPRELRRLEPALARGIAGAQLIEHDHQVDPRRLAAAVQDILAGAGGPGDGPAVAIHRRRLTSLEEIDAERIVLAAGLGAGEIAGPHRRLGLALRPVHGDILRVRVPTSLLAPGEDNLVARTVRATVRGRSVYLVPRADRHLVIGATSREDDLAGTSTGGVHQLLQDAIEIAPSVRETELVEVTTRARPGTPDDLPLLGPVPGDDRVIVSTGYHRHGILLSAWAAQRTAELLEDPAAPRSQLLDAVRPERFTIPPPTASLPPSPVPSATASSAQENP
ncbi:glycine oxidase ThiO [Brachybacterium sp. GCM10030267]|uniref:glycine oxidase ThiO n=1 Tax=unclassified Brachybacterium TaxID=2623841 RepID=UPI00362303F6